MSEDDEVRITLRLPASLRDRLTESAGQRSRSMNGEIVSRLESTFTDRVLDLNDQGIVSTLQGVFTLGDMLARMFFFNRDVELDAFIAEQARQGNVMERTEAVEFILREYLSEHGYVVEPPRRRRGLEGL